MSDQNPVRSYDTLCCLFVKLSVISPKIVQMSLMTKTDILILPQGSKYDKLSKKRRKIIYRSQVGQLACSQCM